MIDTVHTIDAKSLLASAKTVLKLAHFWLQPKQTPSPRSHIQLKPGISNATSILLLHMSEERGGSHTTGLFWWLESRYPHKTIFKEPTNENEP